MLEPNRSKMFVFFQRLTFPGKNLKGHCFRAEWRHKMQTPFEAAFRLFTWESGSTQSSHYWLCAPHNGFWTKTCWGHDWPTGWSASLLMANASGKHEHLKEAHWMLRECGMPSYFERQRRRPAKNAQKLSNTTKDKYFLIKREDCCLHESFQDEDLKTRQE